MKPKIGLLFIFAGLLALLGGMFFGCIGSLQHIFPGLMNEVLPFYKSRPLHVSLVISWIFLSAIGGIYYYLPHKCDLPLFSKRMASMHLWIFMLTGILILGSYFLGKFGGREYWEFPPVLAIPIIISWILFGINYFKTVMHSRQGQSRKWPVYIWMWGTGIVFFFISYIESYLWILPYFGDNIIKDLTIQWKSYGSIVGSWNMLVYGTAIFLMEKINKDTKIAHSQISFFLFFLGLTNLMFGWSHHLYAVPVAGWIRHIGYAISMTELLILGKIIWDFGKNIKESRKKAHIIPYRFLVASDFWIFLNLILAILISIPAINVFTHGTHITIAHAMGSTIGINSMILLASVFFIIDELKGERPISQESRWSKPGFWIINISLLILWLSLILAGIIKGISTVQEGKSFYEINNSIMPFLYLFAFSGLGLFVGMLLMVIPGLKLLTLQIKRPHD